METAAWDRAGWRQVVWGWERSETSQLSRAQSVYHKNQHILLEWRNTAETSDFSSTILIPSSETLMVIRCLWSPIVRTAAFSFAIATCRWNKQLHSSLCINFKASWHCVSSHPTALMWPPTSMMDEWPMDTTSEILQTQAALRRHQKGLTLDSSSRAAIITWCIITDNLSLGCKVYNRAEQVATSFSTSPRVYQDSWIQTKTTNKYISYVWYFCTWKTFTDSISFTEQQLCIIYTITTYKTCSSLSMTSAAAITTTNDNGMNWDKNCILQLFNWHYLYCKTHSAFITLNAMSEIKRA